ncbi:uncharacterized protein LOC101852791 [Aplysia californica]|uniref:Uncharacterized protein LOC101852791 n=1 Tax=Aplysia californica TaxID=6500 RepID=A0ABM0K163_APLCA|nr:uncharacterized protein LOC101852791 [Aplysia californica]
MMDNCTNFLAKVVLVMAVVMMFSWTASTAPTSPPIKESEKFCILQMEQRSNDTDYCELKSANFEISGKDKAVLTYLCCMGYWPGVLHNYLMYADPDYQTYITYSKDPEMLKSIGRHLKECRLPLDQAPKLTAVDFLNWDGEGQKQEVCRTSMMF